MRSLGGLSTDRSMVLGALAVFLLIAVGAILLVPPNMDEVLPFHALACRIHPAAVLNTFREPCDGTYVLHGPFGLAIMRSYAYVGGLSAVLYAPFHAVWPGITTQYLVGLGWLVLFAALLAGSARRPLLAFCLALAFFPFVLQLVHDTGPIRVSAVAFAGSAVLVRRFAGRGVSLQIAGGAVAGLLFALALEDKPFLVYLLIPAAFFAVAALADDPAGSESGLRIALGSLALRLRRAGPFAVAAAAVLAVGGALVLFARTADGAFYLDHLARTRVAFTLRDVRDAVLLYLTAWLSFAHRVYDLPSPSIVTAMKFSTVAFYAACVAAAAVHVGRTILTLRLVLLLASIVSMIAVFLLTRNVWAGHHVVFVFIPAIVILSDLIAALPRRAATGLVAGFCLLNAATAVIVFAKTPRVDSAWERDRILAVLNAEAGGTAIVNHSAWGIYYVHALYAPRDALVVYTEPLVATDAAAILELSKRTGRRTLYQTCRGPDCTASALDAVFGGAVRFEEVPLQTRDWRLFRAAVGS
ncbi:hypothetical protein [Rhodoplanes roseus]|uniref:Glycosyltransferase RgtA/B/C/D-like domain-containing protein n=1 Tax=Rhodoplanes roseus TaxID=29409 RepID=A0A327KPQ3_9BRAD|nr:hypothetical protein [Rhodoplanes roseus]RAI40829.1 hypothetical protein CH341_22955 [Rhodoplanes roseus]